MIEYYKEYREIMKWMGFRLEIESERDSESNSIVNSDVRLVEVGVF